MRKYLLLLMLVFIFSCQEEETPFIDPGDRLFIGYWEQAGYTDSTQIFERTVKLVDDRYGFAIFPGGEFVENKNAGFCGTPPISYMTYEGTWLEFDHDTLLINTEFWGGDISFFLIIKKLDQKRMEAVIRTLKIELVSK